MSHCGPWNSGLFSLYICITCEPVKPALCEPVKNCYFLWNAVSTFQRSETGSIMIYFIWLGPLDFCLLPTGVQLLVVFFFFAPVFQWCCSIPQGSPGVGRNTLCLSSPHLCFSIVFIRDFFISRYDPLMS